jgi:hypothetical protein
LYNAPPTLAIVVVDSAIIISGNAFTKMSDRPLSMTETIKRRLKEKGIGRYEVTMIGSREMSNESRRDLEATNLAVASMLRSPNAEHLHLFVSVYGITGETIPKKKKEQPVVMIDVNVFNVLLVTSRNNLL